MNTIARLQADLAAAQADATARTQAIQEFKCHLAGAKFSGTDPDGSRRDWIAVADVQAWMAYLLTAGE